MSRTVNASAGNIEAELPPLDTEGYSEVISRLDRSAGMLAKNIVEVPRLGEVRPSPEEKTRITATRRQIARHAVLLLHLVERLEPTTLEDEGSPS